MDDEYYYYCDDCACEHESEEDCPYTLYDCSKCGAEASVQVSRGPIPDEPDEAYCDACGWNEVNW